MSTPGHQRTYRNNWLEAGVYVVSILLAWPLVTHFLPPDYAGGGVAFVVLIFALIFRFLFWLLFGRTLQKYTEQTRNQEHARRTRPNQ